MQVGIGIRTIPICVLHSDHLKLAVLNVRVRLVGVLILVSLRREADLIIIVVFC